jgi:hypothetical protein
MKRSTVTTWVTMGVVFGVLACGDDNGTTGPNPPTQATNVQVVMRFDSAVVTWTPGSGQTQQIVTLEQTAQPLTQAGVASGAALMAQETMMDTVGASDAATGFGGLTSGASYTASVVGVNSDGASPDATSGSADVADHMVMVRGTLTSNVTWTRDNIYVLQGPVFVGVDKTTAVTLTIKPGTTIIGDTDPPGGERGSYLVVTRGSKIMADANASLAGDKSVRPDPDSVIVFTSSKPRGSRGRGDWGGVVLNGQAPINSGDEAEGEGESGLYGGDDPLDSSGIVRGVRVEFAGDRATTTDELNGIALQGTGAGTTIEYVQIHYNQDDGTEPFGGTAAQTHMVMTGIGDDSFDGTDGYRSFMQFLLAQQRADDADNGFEISNNGDNETASPQSTTIISNATMVGAGVDLGSGEIHALGGSGDWGVTFREGSHYRVFNSIFTGFGDSGFCVEDGPSAANADERLTGSLDPATTLRFEHNVMWSNVELDDSDANFTACGEGGYSDAENKTFFETAGFDNILADPNLPDEAFDIGTMSSPPNFIPTGAPAGYAGTFDVSTLNNDPAITMPTDGRTLQNVSYVGAFEPGIALSDAWYYGWTVFDPTGLDSRPNHEGN